MERDGARITLDRLMMDGWRWLCRWLLCCQSVFDLCFFCVLLNHNMEVGVSTADQAMTRRYNTRLACDFSSTVFLYWLSSVQESVLQCLGLEM